MRLAVTVTEDVEGKWSAMFLPDTPIDVQKKARKELNKTKGKGKGKQIRRVILL
jgi:hypothetical protein